MTAGIIVSKVDRVFRAGATEIIDVRPDLDVTAAWKIVCGRYPHLKNAELGNPVMEKNRLIYSVDVPPAKSNG